MHSEKLKAFNRNTKSLRTRGALNCFEPSVLDRIFGNSATRKRLSVTRVVEVFWMMFSGAANCAALEVTPMFPQSVIAIVGRNMDGNLHGCKYVWT